MRLHKPLNTGNQDHASGLTKRLASAVRSRVMNCTLGIVAITLFGGACLAQDGLVIRTRGSQAWPTDAEKIYVTACSAVERELRMSHPLRPRVTLVLGARENGAYLDPREIRLSKWDPYMFAQGVVFFAFDELLPERERRAVAKRAVNLVDATVAVKDFRK
jgi:hypothetical protein